MAVSMPGQEESLSGKSPKTSEHCLLFLEPVLQA